MKIQLKFDLSFADNTVLRKGMDYYARRRIGDIEWSALNPYTNTNIELVLTETDIHNPDAKTYIVPTDAVIFPPAPRWTPFKERH